MLCLDLWRILPSKCHFRSSKRANFVKFCHKSRISPISSKSIFSSRRPVVVLSSVLRQKRNALEPGHTAYWWTHEEVVARRCSPVSLCGCWSSSDCHQAAAVWKLTWLDLTLGHGVRSMNCYQAVRLTSLIATTYLTHVYTGWLEIKYPSRHYAISPQPAARF